MRRICTIVLSTAALALGSAAFAQDAKKPEAKAESHGGCHGMQHGKHERHGKREKHDHS
jgi:hypothetical protein